LKRRLRISKTEINGRGDPLRWPRDTLYPQKLALTSPTSGGLSVGIVRLRNKATDWTDSLDLQLFLSEHIELRTCRGMELSVDNERSLKICSFPLSSGAGIAQSVQRLATGWTTERPELESR
jgi:hypothetical protein